ncbi:hypothetical protein EJB05_21835, partial [Eragrostis curvula]
MEVDRNHAGHQFLQPSLVLHHDLTFGPHGDHVLRGRERRRQLELKVPQKMAQYHLDLQPSPMHACFPAPNDVYASPPPARSSSLPGPNRSGSNTCGSLYIEVVHHQRARQHAPLRDAVLAAAGGPHCERPARATEDHRRHRVETQSLLDAAVQDVHPLHDVVVGDPFAVRRRRHEALLLRLDGAQPLGVVEQARRRPCGDGGARVVAGEEQRHEQAGDLRVGRGAAVLVLGIDQRLEHVVIGVGVPGAPARSGDPGENLLEPRARPVAAAVPRRREVREEHADDVHAADEPAQERGHLLVHVLPDLPPQQAPACHQQEHVVHLVLQVHRATLPPFRKVLLYTHKLNAQIDSCHETSQIHILSYRTIQEKQTKHVQILASTSRTMGPTCALSFAGLKVSAKNLCCSFRVSISTS